MPKFGTLTFVKEDGDRKLKDEKGGTVVCDMNYYPWIELGDEYWRLFAASPELYELVRRMYERDQRGDRVTFKDFADMETLLAKVDGEQ